MMVLGEIGGIYQAIASIPSFLISYFIQNLFMSAVTDLMPTKKKAKSSLAASRFNEILGSGTAKTLTPDDAKSLALEAKKIHKRPKLSRIRRLCPCFKSDSKQKLLSKSYREFESKLEISSIVDDQMSLARLTNALLSEEQRLLLRH